MALELIYFNGRGRAELSRLICAEGKLEFKDTRLSEQWPAYVFLPPFVLTSTLPPSPDLVLLITHRLFSLLLHRSHSILTIAFFRHIHIT